MTLAGWIFMLCSLAFVLGLVLFCFFRVLSTPEADDRGSEQPVAAPPERAARYS
jgi:hypothetical protein